jgi:hypothetical protein
MPAPQWKRTQLCTAPSSLPCGDFGPLPCGVITIIRVGLFTLLFFFFFVYTVIVSIRACAFLHFLFLTRGSLVLALDPVVGSCYRFWILTLVLIMILVLVLVLLLGRYSWTSVLSKG